MRLNVSCCMAFSCLRWGRLCLDKALECYIVISLTLSSSHNQKTQSIVNEKLSVIRLYFIDNFAVKEL